MDTYAFDRMTEDLSAMHARKALLLTAVLKDQVGAALFDDPGFVDQLLTARGASPAIGLQVKAAIAAGTTTDATWAGPTAQPRAMLQAFIAAVDRESVLGQLGAVKVPNANTLGAIQTGTASAAWLGETVATPLSSLTFAAASLPSRKIFADVPVSKELLRFANVDMLGLVERATVNAVAAALDVALLDPASAAIAGVKPASLTNGLVGITPAGDFAANLGQVVGALSGGAARRVVLVVSAQTAIRCAALPRLSDYVRVLISPAAGARVVGIDADGISFVDAGGDVRVGAPDIEMSDAPTSPSTAAVVMTSTWQRDLRVVRGERWTNWIRRGDACAYLTLT